jgi:arginine N-succinyltransferase
MLRVRPVRLDDLPQIMHLARLAGIGMVSLPQDEGVMQRRIEDAAASFAEAPHQPKEGIFFFVLEDMEQERLAGTCGIVAHVGMSRPFYSYKLSIISQASLSLGVYSQQQVLHMVNDYTGATEIGSLFLHPDYRRDGVGRFLSRARFLLLAEFPERFSNVVISEIRGVQDAQGNSPFYDNLARHFFQMEFREADYIYATQGGQFIADLMPKYPIYVNLLRPEAQAVIGQAFEASRPAMKFLTDEGFRYEGYVDLFDAGPTIQVERPRIRTVRKSVKARVQAVKARVEGEANHIVCNTRLADFTMARARLSFTPQGDATLERDVAEALGVREGDEIRFVG